MEEVNLYVCRIDKTDLLKYNCKVNRCRKGEFRKKSQPPLKL
mgnify:CR=1 FL=1